MELIVKKIEELRFKKGEFFINNYFRIKNDNIYLTDDFLKILYKGDIDKRLIVSNHKLTVKNMYCLTIGFMRCDNGTKYRWLVAGTCGSSGFNGLEQSSKYFIGINVKRQVIKYIINIYSDSHLCRFEKIFKLKEKINMGKI